MMTALGDVFPLCASARRPTSLSGGRKWVQVQVAWAWPGEGERGWRTVSPSHPLAVKGFTFSCRRWVVDSTGLVTSFLPNSNPAHALVFPLPYSPPLSPVTH